MINETIIEEIEHYLKTRFNPNSHRLKHIYNVKKVAVTLGRLYEADIPSVIVASYLHDITKHESIEENHRLASSLISEDTPQACYHAYAAAKVAKDKFNITDKDILNAIMYHCSGRLHQSLLEKIIFVSDFIEEGRDFVSDELRDLAKKDIDQCVYKIMLQTKAYIKRNNQVFSNLTEEAILYYRKIYGGMDD